MFLLYNHDSHDSLMCYVAKNEKGLVFLIFFSKCRLLCKPTEMTTVSNEAIKSGFYFLSMFAFNVGR